MPSTAPKASSQAGYTLIEILIVGVVLIIVSQAFAIFLQTATLQSTSYRDRAFATDKAVQMVEELRSLVLDDVKPVTVLDSYSDGQVSPTSEPYYKFTLTTKQAVTGSLTDQGTSFPNTNANPANSDFATGTDANSANPLRNGRYVFMRNIEVTKQAGDSSMRNIRVRIWLAGANNGSGADTPVASRIPSDKRPYAEVYAKVKSLGASSPPSQVMDVYLIALESVPGWWSRTSNLQPLMQSSINSLQARNPGLNIRAHWIKRMSYGRDQEYTPEINKSALATASGALKKAYVYPGYITWDDGPDYYYSPDWFTGRMNVDHVIDYNDGYAVADQYNHAMRYGDELALYQIHKTMAINNAANPVTPVEPSLRMLIERLNNSDPTLQNSMIIDLHGEMVPVVPLRNYSDAAKDPRYYWVDRPALGVAGPRAFRAVTHPEKLHFTTSSEDAAVRVYAYCAVTSNAASDATDPISDVTLFIPGANINNIKEIDRMQGLGNTSAPDRGQPYHWYASTAALMTRTAGAVYDGVGSSLPGVSTWEADNFTPPGRSAGLRIRLMGVSATAGSYTGHPWP